MIKFLKNKKTIIIILLIILLPASAILYGSIDGRTGRTLKSSTSGCGGCHGSAFTPDVSVSFNGPDTVIQGQTVQYTLTINRATKTGAGLDIATRNGILAPVSSNIHLAAGELTHNNNIPLSGGNVSISFTYTAPSSSLTDTLWATAIATNSDGLTSGDDWNWAPSKRITVRAPLGINNNHSVVKDFKLEQNYPNPFNPSTKIRFSLPKSEFVSIEIFDITGNEIYTLVNSSVSAGSYSVEWNSVNNSGENVSSGVYFYVIKAGTYTETRRMILVR